MMNVLLYSFIGILFIVILIRYGRYCYRLGVSSTTGALNVLCEEDKNGFIFYNLLTETFLCQSADYNSGVSALKNTYPNIDIVVSMASRTKIIDEVNETI